MVTVKKSVAKKTAAKGGTKKAARKGGAAKMPTFSKSPPQLVAFFTQVMAAVPMAETRRMFGYPAGFANGQMFASLFGDSFILRLPEPEREAFMKKYDAHLFEPMPGRPMREYVAVPPKLLTSGKVLDDWLARSVAYAQSLPPKAAKAKRK